MALKVLAQSCKDGTCPQVLAQDEDTVIVQGYEVDLPTPDGERAVAIPRALLHQAAEEDARR